MTRTARFLSLFGAAALAAVLALPGSADAALNSISGKPKVSFFAEGSPGALDIEGVASDVKVADDGTNLTITVGMKSIETGIDLRDEHMCNEFAKCDEFPSATLVVPKASIQWGAAVGERKTGTVQGQFTAHGVTKPVSVEYSTQKSKTGFRVTGKFNFDISQHGVAIPSYLGVTVDAKMRAEATLDLVDA